MTTPRRRHRLPSTVRLLFLVLALAGAPASLAAESPAPENPPVASADPEDPKTSKEIEAELKRAEEEQARIAAQLAEQQRLVEELESLQNELKGQIDQTATALNAINADLNAVRSQITIMVGRIEEVKAKYSALVAELAELDADLADLIVKENAKRVELRERQAVLSDRMRAAYDTDRTSLLEIFLSGGSFSDVLAEVSYHLDVGAQDKALAERIRTDQATLETLRETIESTRVQTNRVRQETAVQKKELDAELALLEQAKAHLAELEAKTAAELAHQQQAFERLSDNREALRAAIADAEVKQRSIIASVRELVELQAKLGHIPSEYNGTFIWPLVAEISGEWGCSLYEGYGPGGPGCDHFHNGIDIVDECGTEIVAAGDGVVAYADFNWADGADPAFVIVIAHSTNVKTWYAHLEPKTAVGIVPGTLVKAGDVIGYEGNTGHSTGCHLHWMVELNGQFVNPRLFL